MLRWFSFEHVSCFLDFGSGAMFGRLNRLARLDSIDLRTALNFADRRGLSISATHSLSDGKAHLRHVILRGRGSTKLMIEPCTAAFECVGRFLLLIVVAAPYFSSDFACTSCVGIGTQPPVGCSKGSFFTDNHSSQTKELRRG